MRKAILLVLCVIMVISMSACGNNEIAFPLAFSEEFDGNVPKSFVASENERFTLSFDKTTKRIILQDKISGLPLSYTPVKAQEPRLDEFGFEASNHPQLESGILVTYFNTLENVNYTLNSYTGSVKKGDYSIEQTENGMSVTYRFVSEQISVTVDYILRDDSLLITIDPSKITEGENPVISIGIAPFLCSVENETEDSYLFYPSGSGALIYADSTNDDIQIVSEEVYGEDARRPDDDVIKTATTSIKIPVYGSKDENNAVTAIIEEGAEAAEIVANVGNPTIGFSAVYASFCVRGRELALTNTWSGQRTIYSDAMTTEKMSIGFYPIYGEDANYNGMAKTYRNYLIKNGMTKSNKEEQMLNLQILGGTQYTKSILGVPYDSVYTTTTISQAKQMIEEISELTEQTPVVSLLGFTQGGIDIGKLAGNLKIGSHVGNEADLRELAAYCSKNSVPLYLDLDVLLYSKSSNLASTAFDSTIAVNGRNTLLYYYHTHSGTRNTAGKGWNNSSSFTMLSRSLIPKVLEKVSGFLNQTSINGVSLGTLSYIAYSDYSEQKYFVKGQMATQVSTEFNKLKTKGYSVLATDANAYAAANATRVFEVPVMSSRYDIFDTDIPFYQLVFKGYVPMSVPSVSASADMENSVLAAIESGSGLGFALSYDYSNQIIGNSNMLYYGSNYSYLKDTIADIARQHQEYYQAVKGAVIISHTIITETLRKTVFDNGISVIVNYSDEAVETEFGTVEAKRYLMSKRGNG